MLVGCLAARGGDDFRGGGGGGRRVVPCFHRLVSQCGRVWKQKCQKTYLIEVAFPISKWVCRLISRCFFFLLGLFCQRRFG